MTDGQRRNLELVSFLAAGALAGVLTGLVAPLGAFSRAELPLFYVASALFGTMAWISARRRSLFPGLLLVIVFPVASELLHNPATRAATLAAAFRFVPAVVAYLGAGLVCRGRRPARGWRVATLAGFLALALFAGATAAGLVLREPFRIEWQPVLAGLVLGALSALLFEAVDFLLARPASR